MFGYVIANVQALSPEDQLRYKSAYCSLCHGLGRRHGLLSRLSLNYDMTFLIVFLSAVYKQEEQPDKSRCSASPLKEKPFFRSSAVDYAADMNIALCYYNALDDWQDEGKLLSLAQAKLLKGSCERVRKAYPRQCGVMEECLKALSEMEKAGEFRPDLPAGCFGRLMGEVFAWKEDQWAQPLRDFGFALGKFIYILDACMDLKEDLQKERYNPMTGVSEKDFEDILYALMAEVVRAYGCFTAGRDQSLIEHILFSGVLTRYEVWKRRGEEKR